MRLRTWYMITVAVFVNVVVLLSLATVHSSLLVGDTLKQLWCCNTRKTKHVWYERKELWTAHLKLPAISTLSTIISFAEVHHSNTDVGHCYRGVTTRNVFLKCIMNEWVLSLHAPKVYQLADMIISTQTTHSPLFAPSMLSSLSSHIWKHKYPESLPTSFSPTCYPGLWKSLSGRHLHCSGLWEVDYRSRENLFWLAGWTEWDRFCLLALHGQATLRSGSVLLSEDLYQAQSPVEQSKMHKAHMSLSIKVILFQVL